MIMEKILIFGSSGLLGNAFADFLKNQKGLKLFLPDRQECDITNKAQLEKIFQIKPNLVINCAADINQDLIEEKPESGLKINFLAVYYLAKLCKENKCEFMYFGTTQDKKVTNVYSLTKRMIRCIPESIGLKKYYFFRLGWLFGPSKKNNDFINFIVESLKQNKRLGLTNNRWGSAAYTKDTVNYCWKQYLKKNYGIFDVANQGRVSKWQLAIEVSHLIDIKHNFHINNNFSEKSARCRDSSIRNAPLRHYKKALKEFLYGN